VLLDGQVIAAVIPEPKTYALMLAGVLGFMARPKKVERK
jgi:hypothetical protein